MNQLTDIERHRQKQDFLFEHRKAMATRVIANMVGGAARDRVVEQADATIAKLQQENPTLFNPSYVLDVPVFMKQLKTNDWRFSDDGVDVSVAGWVYSFFAASFTEDEKIERRSASLRRLVALTEEWLAKEPKKLLQHASALYPLFGVSFSVTGRALLSFGDEEVEAQAVSIMEDLPVHPMMEIFCENTLAFVLSPRNQIETLLQKNMLPNRKMEACVRLLLKELEEKDADIARLEKRLNWVEHAVKHLKAGTEP